MKRPGEVKIKPVKESIGRRLAFEIGGFSLAAITAYAMAFCLIFVFAVLAGIVGAIDSCGSKPQVQTQATPTPETFRPIPGATFVPSSPTQVAGSFGLFQVHANAQQTASIIAFTYEEIHVIVVRRPDQIPPAVLAEAQQFIGGSTGRPIQPRDSDSSLQLDFLKDDVSFPSIAAAGAGEEKRVPYVIVGDVDIVCGSLVGLDRATADFFLENDDIKTARLSSAKYFQEFRPVRFVYVVGSIKSFTGPKQLGHSFSSTRILDLTATHQELAEFRDKYEKWLNEIKFLAQIHGVKPWDLMTHEGEQVTFESAGILGRRVVRADGSASTSGGYGWDSPGGQRPGARPEERVEHPEPSEVPRR